MKIKTDSTPLEDPKNPDTCNAFAIYKLLASESEIETMKEGDVLFFKKPELSRLLVNGLPAFDVQVGTIGAQTAVQIERACIPGMQ